MKGKITIGMLLYRKLITRKTEVKINLNNLRELHLINTLQKNKLIKIDELKERGMIKK